MARETHEKTRNETACANTVGGALRPDSADGEIGLNSTEGMATKNTKNAKTKPEEIAVFLTRQNGSCAECGTDLVDGTMIRLEQERPLCLDCADLGHLEFLASGNTALTRRATKHS